MAWVARPACVVPSVTALAKDASLREQLIDPAFRYRVTNRGGDDGKLAQRCVSFVPESKPHRFYDAMNHCRNEQLTMPLETAEKTYERLLLRYDEPRPGDDDDQDIDAKIDRIVREVDEIDAEKTRAIRLAKVFACTGAMLDDEEAILLQHANDKIRHFLSELSRIKSPP